MSAPMSHELKQMEKDKDDEARVGESAIDENTVIATPEYEEFVALERIFINDRLKALTVSVIEPVLRMSDTDVVLAQG